MDFISILILANIIVHLGGGMLDLFELTPNKMKFIIISDAIIFLASLTCCPLSAVIWGFATYFDWKRYGWVFK